MSAVIPIQLGSVFSHLTVINGPLPQARSMYLCRCDCGREKVIRGVALRHGMMKSCGCSLKTDRPTTSKYGQSGEWNKPEYRIWVGIKARCLNPRNRNWQHYGGRGITICQRWLESYAHFLHDMGRRPTAKHSIDRLNTDGHYSPANCRWATRSQQQNNRPDNHWIEWRGISLTISGWSQALKIPYRRLYNHLRRKDFDIGRTLGDIARIDRHDEPSIIPFGASAAKN